MTKDRLTLIVDADMLAYAACAASMDETEWEPFQWMYTCDLEAAQAHFKASLANMAETAESTELALALTSPTNFRVGLSKSYKSGRSKKPPGYAAFRQWVHETYPTWEREGLEGDDIIGILATMPGDRFADRIIWSGDKDLKQIPGVHLRGGRRDHLDIVEITPAEGERWHAVQTLTGDVTDGYPGLKGVGPVAANKILDKAPDGDLWGAVEAAYIKAGQTREDMLVQARLAKILQSPDYDFNTRKPILWNPPK